MDFIIIAVVQVGPEARFAHRHDLPYAEQRRMDPDQCVFRVWIWVIGVERDPL
jgi:hypothetical protein